MVIALIVFINLEHLELRRQVDFAALPSCCDLMPPQQYFTHSWTTGGPVRSNICELNMVSLRHVALMNNLAARLQHMQQPLSQNNTGGGVPLPSIPRASGENTPGGTDTGSDTPAPPVDSPLRVFPAGQINGAAETPQATRRGLVQIDWQLPAASEVNAGATQLGDDHDDDDMAIGHDAPDGDGSDVENEEPVTAQNKPRRRGKLATRKRQQVARDKAAEADDPQPTDLPEGMEAVLVPHELRICDSSMWGIREISAGEIDAADPPNGRRNGQATLFKPGSGPVAKRWDTAVYWAGRALDKAHSKGLDFSFAVSAHAVRG